MMKKAFIIAILIVFALRVQAQTANRLYMVDENNRYKLTNTGASHLAALPLKCLQQEYPNKTGHISESEIDHVITPARLHPVFYGCFDWHSSVHGHWMLVRLLKDFPQLPEAQAIRTTLNTNITPENITQEIAYFNTPISKSFERTYGWAWLLKLQQELITFPNDTDAAKWSKAIQPLCDTIISRWLNFLPKQTYANRTGVHPNTAFGLALALDYTRATNNKEFEKAIIQSAMFLYANDKNAPAAWEPNGSDFFSPALMEADLMRRVLPQKEYIRWLNDFLPYKTLQHLTQLPIVSDRNDYQIVHLDGLCFSRCWCMQGIASQLPDNDKRKQLLLQSATQHLNASLPHIANSGYGGEHWLASFAVYALCE